MISVVYNSHTYIPRLIRTWKLYNVINVGIYSQRSIQSYRPPITLAGEKDELIAFLKEIITKLESDDLI